MKVEARYVEQGEGYTLTLYDRHPRLTDMKGAISSRPEWLINIVTMATVGEHFLSVPDPPPDRILWFFIDEHCNLVDIDTFT